MRRTRWTWKRLGEFLPRMLGKERQRPEKARALRIEPLEERQLLTLVPALDTIGQYDAVTAHFYLRNANTAGTSNIDFGFGNANWVPVTGDWNNDGVDTIGAYDRNSSSWFYERNSNTTGNADITFGFGAAGWLPVMGDWDGNGTDTVGLYDPAGSVFYLRNSNDTGFADYSFAFGTGNAGWLPVAGDWDGNGADGIGLYDPNSGTFYLKNGLSAGGADSTFQISGGTNLVPIAGDWDQNAVDTIGLFSKTSATYYLKNTNAAGALSGFDYQFGFGQAYSTSPAYSPTPLAGHWTNKPPTLNAIANPTAINEDAGQQTISLSGIGAGSGESQTLAVTAWSSNTAIVPHPTVTYTSANATGSLAYTPAANANGIVTITVRVSDPGPNGTFDSLTSIGAKGDDGCIDRTFTVAINAINDTPILDWQSGQIWMTPISEDQANNAGTLVRDLVAARITDGDGANAAKGIAILVSNDIDGYWQYSLNGGSTWTNLGSPTQSCSRLLAADDLTRIRFVPAANYFGTVVTIGSNEYQGFAFYAWDQTVGQNGGTADTSSRPVGGAFSDAMAGARLVVSAVNDLPVRTAGSPTAISVNEDSANATAVTLGLGTLNYGPGGGTYEASQTLTYKVTAIPACIGLFQSDGTTSVPVNTTLTLAQLQGLKYKTLANASGSGNLTWTVQDSGGTASGGVDTLTENLSVMVAAVNDQPQRIAGSPPALSVNEDSVNSAAVSLGLGALNYGPGGGTYEASQTLSYKLAAIPACIGLFQSDGTTSVPVNTTLTLAQLQGLKYKTLANVYGSGNLTWTVQDNGGTASGGVDTLTENLSITVASVNDLPTVSAIGKHLTTGNTQPLPISFTVGDVETAAGSLTIAATSSNTTIVSAAGIVFGGSGANRTVTITPAGGQIGTATITLTVTDTDGGQTIKTFDVSTPTASTADTIGQYSGATSHFYLRNSNDTGVSDVDFGFGTQNAGWRPVVGDWNQNGVDTVGLYDQASSTVSFWLIDSNSSVPPDYAFAYGTPGSNWLPIAGDWNGDGMETIGLYDPVASQFYLRNSNTTGGADISFGFGTANASLLPIAGDWNGDGIDTIGLYDPASKAFLLRNTNTAGAADLAFTVTFNEPPTGALLPFAGDWSWASSNGNPQNAVLPDGVDTIGLLAQGSGTYYLWNTNAAGNPGWQFGFGSTGSAVYPLAGDWTGVWNTSPTGVVLTGSSVLENQATGTVIGTFSSSDIDPNSSFNYSLVSGAGATDNGSFTIAGNQLKTAAAFNYETQLSYSIRIRSTDQAGMYLDSPFTISVIDVNEAPSFTKGSNQTAAEDAGAQIVANWATSISCGPGESGQTLNFLVSNDNSSLFAAPPAISPTGTLTYTPAANANGSATVTVALHDNGGTTNGGSDTSSAQTFTLNIAPVNDQPTMSAIADPAAILEDASQQVVSLNGISAGPANESSQTLTVTATSNNTALIPNPAVSYISSSASGTLSYAPVANASGSAVITVTVSDNGGAANGGVNAISRTFTVNVTAMNDLPTLDAIGVPAMIDEDAAQQTVNLTGISAGGAESQTLEITASSSNTGLIPNPTVSYTPAESTGGLSYAPVANQNGSATITVTLRDAGLDNILGNGDDASVQQTFTVIVNPVNDLPTLDSIIDPAPIINNAPEQTILLSGITAGPLESQTLEVTAISNNTALIPNPSVTYTSPAATGTLSYTPAPNQYGTASITVTVRDAGLDGELGNADDAVSNRTFSVVVDSAPTSISLASSVIYEHWAPEAAALTLATNDTNPNDSITYTLVDGEGGADNEWFEIVGDTLRPAATMNDVPRDSFSARVAAANQAGRSTQRVLTLVLGHTYAAIDDPALTCGIGVYAPNSSTFMLRNAHDTGPANFSTPFGELTKTRTPIAGDWDGDGDDTLGLFYDVESSYWVSNTNLSGYSDVGFGFGVPGAGWKPVVGNWDGLGVTPPGRDFDTAGLYDPVNSVFYLRNTNTTGAADVAFGFGTPNAGWLPVAGDWDGDGVDTIGLYDPTTSSFYLNNANDSSSADITFGFGAAGAGWLPVAGDWNGDGIDTVGLYDPATSLFYLRNCNTTGAADIACGFGAPGAGWMPLAGSWNLVPETTPKSYVLSSMNAFSNNVLTGDIDPELVAELTTQNVTPPSHAAAFTVEPNGAFTYTPAIPFGTDSFTYQAFDGAKLSTAAPVTIRLGSISLSAASIAENQDAGTLVGQFATTTLDTTVTATSAFRHSLAYGPGDDGNSCFTIDAEGHLKTVRRLDHETQPSYSIRVRSTDQNDQWIEQVFTIAVSNANDPPSFTKGADVTTNPGVSIDYPWATNISSGDTISDPAQTAQFAAPTFVLTPSNQTFFDVTPTIDSAGHLHCTLSGAATGFATVTVHAYDSGGLAANGNSKNSPDQTFVIRANTVPTIEPIASSHFQANGGAICIPIVVSDAETPADQLNVNIQSLNGAIIPQQAENISWTKLATLPGNKEQYNLTLTPVADSVGTVNFIITVADSVSQGTPLQATTTFSVATPVNCKKDQVGVYNYGQTGWYPPPVGTLQDAWYALRNSTSAASVPWNPTGSMVVGDWDGDGVDTLGVFEAPVHGTAVPGSGHHERFTLYDSNASNALSTQQFHFDPASLPGGSSSECLPVAGDWDGDGVDTVGVYDKSSHAFYLANSNTADSTYKTFAVTGVPGYAEPVVGDWDGDGKDTVGVFDRIWGVFYLWNATAPTTLSTSSPDCTSFEFDGGLYNRIVEESPPGSGQYASHIDYYSISMNTLPVAGDWDGDGVDTVGLCTIKAAAGSQCRWGLTNSSTGVGNLVSFAYATTTDWPQLLPMAGDWNGPWVDTPAMGGTPPEIMATNNTIGADEDASITTSLQNSFSLVSHSARPVVYRVASVTNGTLAKIAADKTAEDAVIVASNSYTTLGAGESFVWTPPVGASGHVQAFTLQAWDGRLASTDTVSLYVDLYPGNKTPFFTAGASQTLLTTAGAQTVAWATSISPGRPSEASQALNFIVNTDKPELFSTLPQIDSNGVLTLTPAVGASDGVATVTVQLHDSGGATSAAKVFTILILAPASDYDHDGLVNSEELARGTKPNAADSDGDGMSDGWEVRYAVDPQDRRNRLDPLSIDANHNGLPDAGEDFDRDGALTNREESRRNTNPFAFDTDSDGTSDVYEINQGSDPTFAGDAGQAAPDDMAGTFQWELYVGPTWTSEGYIEQWSMSVENHTASVYPIEGTADPYDAWNCNIQAGQDYTIRIDHSGIEPFPEGCDYDSMRSHPHYAWDAVNGSTLPAWVEDPHDLFSRENILGYEDDRSAGKTATLHVFKLDADVDSNNDGGFDPPADSMVEDQLEQVPFEGKVAWCDAGDADHDGTLNCDEFDPIPEAHFTPMVIRLSQNFDVVKDFSKIRVTFAYDESKIRIWKPGRDASTTRTEAADMIHNLTPISAHDLGLSPGGSVTVYIQSRMLGSDGATITVNAWTETSDPKDPWAGGSDLLYVLGGDALLSDVGDGIVPIGDELEEVLLSVSAPFSGNMHVRAELSAAADDLAKIRVWDFATNSSAPILAPGSSRFSWDLSSGISKPLFVEGLEAGDVTLHLRLLNLDSQNTVAATDELKLSVAAVDLAIDSNDDGAITAADDAVEDIAGVDATPGKVILVQDQDSDSDGVLNWADGFDLLSGWDTDDVSQNAAFVPLTFTVPAGLDLSDALIDVEYNDSSPNAISVDSLSQYFEHPNDGNLRIWTKDASAARNKALASAGGDFVASGTYTAADLGITAGTNTLYVKAINASATTGGDRISFRLFPSGFAGTCFEDSVRVTATRIQIMADNQDGTPQKEVFHLTATRLPNLDADGEGGVGPDFRQVYTINVFDPRATIDHVFVEGVSLPVVRSGDHYTTANPFIAIPAEDESLIAADQPLVGKILYQADFRYKGYFTPDDEAANPIPWQVNDGGVAGQATPTNGILHVNTLAVDSVYTASLTDPGYWLSNQATELQLRFRIDAYDPMAADGALKLLLGDGSQYWEVGVRPDGLVTYPQGARSETAFPLSLGNVGSLLDGNFHTLAFSRTAQAGAATLSVDGEPIVTAASAPGGAFGLLWGDPGVGVAGYVEYDYLDWQHPVTNEKIVFERRPSDVIGSATVVTIVNPEPVISYNPQTKTAILHAQQILAADQTIGELVKQVVTEMASSEWTPPPDVYNPADAGAFGKEVDKRVSARLENTTGWLGGKTYQNFKAGVLVNQQTKEVVAFGFSGGKVGCTQVDAMYCLDGYNPKVGDILDRDRILVYEVRTSASGAITSDQATRLRALSSKDLRKVLSQYKYSVTTSKLVENPKFLQTVKIIGIFGGIFAAGNAWIQPTRAEDLMDSIREDFLLAKSKTGAERKVTAIMATQRLVQYFDTMSGGLAGDSMNFTLMVAIYEILGQPDFDQVWRE